MVNTSLRQQLHFFALEPTDSRTMEVAVRRMQSKMKKEERRVKGWEQGID